MSQRRPGVIPADAVGSGIAMQRQRRLRVGLLLTVLTLSVTGVVIATWGPIYGRYGWRVLSITALWMEALLLGLIVEGLRPQNPYRHLDHRFSFLDRPPTNVQQDADTSDLWYAVPGLAISLLLLLSLAAV